MSPDFSIAALDAPYMTLLFLTTIAALATALILMFREMERSERLRRVRVSLARLLDRSGR